MQGTWQYLEPIFSSPDILKQMPEEGEKFQVVDQAWREVRGGREEPCAGEQGGERREVGESNVLVVTTAPPLSLLLTLSSLFLQIMESASLKPGCLVIGADREKLVMLEENNK